MFEKLKKRRRLSAGSDHLPFAVISLWASRIGLLIFFSSHPLAIAQTNILTAVEQRLPPFQQQSLQHDLPINDVKFDQQGDLWMAGQKSIWRWNLTTNKLRRIELTKHQKNSRGKLSALGTDALSLFTATATGLFQLTWEPFRVFQYSLPAHAPGKTYGFSGSGDRLTWLHSSGIYRIDRYGKSLVKIRDIDFVRPKDKVLYQSQSENLWLLRKNNLMLVHNEGPRNGAQIVHQSAGKLHTLAEWRGFVVTHTKKSVLFFEKSGSLNRAIPVARGRKLSRISLSTNKHYYLFQDGLVEVYDTEQKIRQSFIIAQKPKQRITKIEAWRDRMALLGPKQLRLMRFPKAVD